jgi:5S rRNA maturation endonuclease (ribonuclease M5)
MTKDDVLPKLKRISQTHNGWKACCPAHDDFHPSLSISEPDGKLLLYCHAGCSFEQIINALSIETNGNGTNGNGAASKKESKQIISKRPAAEYDYIDETGKLLYKIVRNELTYSDGTKDKSFIAKRKPKETEIPNLDGWIYNTEKTRLVLYRLPEASASETVFLVEGEKDVETLRQNGFTATCNPFGAGKWRNEYNESLRGKIVVILPDNDEAGRKHAEQVANSLHGIAKDVFVITLPNLKEKGDITDFFDCGGTADELMRLVEKAEIWKPTQQESKFQSASKFVFTPLDKLLEEPDEETDFVWADTLPCGGFSICSAKPKVGKSTMARNLAVAISKGESFLGRATVKGKVLYLCLEEKRGEVKKHFEKMGANSADIFIHTGATPENAIAELAVAIAEIEPVLVIIDPLSRVLRVRDFNDYGGMARGLEPLIDLARKTNCHILALHHDSKMERSGGDAMLGSTALFGAVDCHIQMRKRDNGRTIATSQRYADDLPETVIELDKETGIVTAQGDFQSYILKKVKTEILKVVGDGEEQTEQQIKGRIEGFSQGVISKAIRELFDEKQLNRKGEGKKGNPFIYSKIQS